MKAIAAFPLLCFLSEAKEDDLHGTDPLKSGAWLILKPRMEDGKSVLGQLCGAGCQQTLCIVMITQGVM